MSSTPSSPHFMWVDVEQWTLHGMITPQQAIAIRRYVEANGTMFEQEKTGIEQHKRLNFITIAYYTVDPD